MKIRRPLLLCEVSRPVADPFQESLTKTFRISQRNKVTAHTKPCLCQFQIRNKYFFLINVQVSSFAPITWKNNYTATATFSIILYLMNVDRSIVKCFFHDEFLNPTK